MISSSASYQAAITGKSRRIYLRTVIDISDPDKVISTPTTSAAAPWSKATELYDHVMTSPARYATLEPGRWLLDGTFSLIPDNNSIAKKVGFALSALSGEDGTFEESQYIQLNFTGIDVLQAFCVYFSDDEVDGVAEDFTVEVYAGDQLYFSETVTGNTDTMRQFEGFTVYTPTAIKLTVTKWSLPYRRVRVMEIFPGTYEEWDDSMLAAFDLTQQGKFDCLTLPYGTLNLTFNNKSRRFEPRSKSGVFQSIEERQGVEAYIGVKIDNDTIDYKPLGVYYQYGDGWKTGDNSMSMQWSLVDIVGLLANRTFILKGSMPTTLQGWIAALVAQLGSNFSGRYTVDSSYASLSVTANSTDDISGKSCGDILRWACMVTGTWPRADSETGKLAVEPLWSQGNKVLLRNLVNYPTMKANESIAALIFKLDGSGDEYVISGNSTSSEKTVTVENPFIHTSEQALSAAKMILSCYGGNLIETEGRGDPSSEIGDVDTIWLDKSQATTARRMSQSFTIQDHVLQGCKSTLLQADGSYLYEASEVITNSGTWTSPAGVTKLRVVLGGGGQGGGKGEAGYIERGGNVFGTQVVAEAGEDGVDGHGGMIWYDTINVNEQQEITISIGKGGAPGGTYGDAGSDGGNTTITVGGVTYSSANGKIYDLGYTDILNGNSYGRTGVEVPLNGTSDGGKGGAGGAAGIGYMKSYTYRPSGAASTVVNTAYELVVLKEPGNGDPGAAGADGFVLVFWDKEEAS